MHRSRLAARGSLVPVLVPVLVLSGALGACSNTESSGSLTTAASGTVGDLTLDGISAIAVVPDDGTEPGDDDDDSGVSAGQTGLSIALADKVNTCTAVHDADSTVLAIFLTGTIAARTYTVATSPMPGDGEVVANLSHNDASCSSSNYPLATGGTVTVTEASATSVQGRFALTFESGQVSGTFAAPICPSDPSTSDDGGVVCSE